MAKPLTPEILFEDPNILILNKPAGLLSQGDVSGEENLVDWLRAYLGRHYVGLIHRLDRNTSGLMVIAKRSKPAERLTRALQAGKICRTYQAWISGELLAPESWKDFLWKDERQNLVRVVRDGTEGAKSAGLKVTPIRTMHVPFKATLAQFDLETGRSHQIRIQAAHHKHPLLGDAKYAPPKIAKLAERPLLHSAHLTLEHPITHEPLEFSSPLPKDMVF